MKKIAWLLAAMTLFVLSCSKPGQNDKKEDKKQDETEAPITIDGDFTDWADLKGAVSARNSSESLWEAVKELRVYAHGDYVYYYIRFDKETMKEFFEANDTFPARVNLNTDGEFSSGYQNYFLQGYDFIIEMSLGNGAGGWATAENGTLCQRINDGWSELLGENSGLTIGKGNGYEYELMLDRTIFNDAVAKSAVPMPMEDTFQTSMRFYETSSSGKWEELSNMPNADGGYGNLLEVTFSK